MFLSEAKWDGMMEGSILVTLRKDFYMGMVFYICQFRSCWMQISYCGVKGIKIFSNISGLLTFFSMKSLTFYCKKVKKKNESVEIELKSAKRASKRLGTVWQTFYTGRKCETKSESFRHFQVLFQCFLSLRSLIREFEILPLNIRDFSVLHSLQC